MTLDSDLHLRATQRMIDANPSTVIPMRRTRVANGTGGWTTSDPVEQSPVVCRKVGISINSNISRVTADGAGVLLFAHVISLPDADIQVGDRLSFGDVNVEVLDINFDPPWRLMAEVYRVV